MSDIIFLALLAVALVGVYRAVAPHLVAGQPTNDRAATELFSDQSSWWIGLLLGFAAIATVGLAAVTEDSNFRLFALMFAFFGTAMSAAEIIRRVDAWRRIRATAAETVR